jgi:hypothetical protein
MRRRVVVARLFGFFVAIATGAAAPAWSDGTTERVSVGLAFISAATNLVPGDTNGESDVFVRVLAP